VFTVYFAYLTGQFNCSFLLPAWQETKPNNNHLQGTWCGTFPYQVPFFITKTEEV